MNKFRSLEKIVILILFFFVIQNFNVSSSADELFQIQAKNVKYQNKKNTIIAEGNAEASNSLDKKLFADKITYKKKEGIIIAIGNAKFSSKNSIITADQFEYNANSKIVVADNNVILEDKKGNKFFFNKLNYNNKTQKGKADYIKSILIDGSYSESSEGIIDNKNQIYLLKDTNYTTCINKFDKQGKFCPSWSLKSKQLIHDKKNRRIKHKNVLLNVKNFPILYSPYLSHPDPDVKRQSGFLVPTIKTISNLGRTIKTPYFIALSPDKDLTITPIFYFDEENLLNASYRQAFKKGLLEVETSFTKGYRRTNKLGRTKGSRNYFFAEYNEQKENLFFKNNELNFKIQRISQQNYVKVNKLQTKLFKEDIRTLENTFRFQSYDSNKRLDIKTGFFENLDIDDTSKYTYYFPDGVFSLYSNKNKLFKFNLNSHFQGKKFEKKQKQGKIKNDFNIKGNQYINKNLGFASSLNLSLYNKNIYNDNVPGISNNLNINNNFSIALDNQWPLAKLEKNSYKTFVPRIFLKYTSGNMQNAKGQSKTLEYSDIFSMNRTNNTDTVETGASLGYGFDYFSSKNKINSIEKIYSSKIGFGQILRKKREDALPTISSLNNKSSDFVGYVGASLFGNKIDNFKSIENDKIQFLKNFNQNQISVNYKFNIENDFSEIIRNTLNLRGYYNNFYSSIALNQKSNHIGDEKFGTINLKKILSQNYYFNIESKKNLKTNASEYNRFSINFENDCILTSLTYSKDFYNDKDITNSKTLIFGITIKPFSDSLGPDLTEFIN